MECRKSFKQLVYRRLICHAPTLFQHFHLVPSAREQNAEFFKAYHVRLKIKDQIVMFNYLLEQQVHRMSDKGK